MNINISGFKVTSTVLKNIFYRQVWNEPCLNNQAYPEAIISLIDKEKCRLVIWYSYCLTLFIPQLHPEKMSLSFYETRSKTKKVRLFCQIHAVATSRLADALCGPYKVLGQDSAYPRALARAPLAHIEAGFSLEASSCIPLHSQEGSRRGERTSSP